VAENRQAWLTGSPSAAERFQGVSLVHRPMPPSPTVCLHHVPNPLQFWYRLGQLVKAGLPVLVMDLLRPDSPEEAQAIVDRYAAKGGRRFCGVIFTIPCCIVHRR